MIIILGSFLECFFIMVNNIENIAIVGMGSAGRRHFNVIRKLFPQKKISIIRSGKGEKCPEDELANYNFSSISEACEIKIDAAIIASPANLHIEQSEELIKRKIHVLIEKPISISKDKVMHLHKLAHENSVVAQLGYVLRHNKSLQYFNSIIKKGYIGKPVSGRVVCSSYLPNWRSGQDYKVSVSARPELGGGVLLELSHELDYLMWIFGKFIEVQAQIVHSEILDVSCADTAMIIAKQSNGFVSSTHLDFNSHINIRQCHVTGSDGTMVWDGINHKVTYNGKEGSFTKYFRRGIESMYEKQILSFFKACSKNNVPSVTLRDGFSVMYAIESIEKSNKHRMRVIL